MDMIQSYGGLCGDGLMLPNIIACAMLPQEKQRKELSELFSGDQNEEAFEDFEASPDDEREQILCIYAYYVCVNYLVLIVLE